jgi:hypothetical protein
MEILTFVMSGLPGIHVFAARFTDVDGRDKPGHGKKSGYYRPVLR